MFNFYDFSSKDTGIKSTKWITGTKCVWAMVWGLLPYSLYVSICSNSFMHKKVLIKATNYRSHWKD